MDIGVFIPIGNNGWLISTTSPQYLPSFDLNQDIVLRAERHGFDFAMSMIKLRGFGGASRFWDYNLESFTLMAGLASVTKRIKLFASVSVLSIPPAVIARMAVTIDSISHGRFGVNLVTGWQAAEYQQMGLWPGPAYFSDRYAYLTEYTTILNELWRTGRTDLKGQFFTMEDCRLLPLPGSPITLICAGQSDRGMRFAAEFCDFNFCGASGINAPERFAPTVARLQAEADRAGRGVGSMLALMVIAAETDAEAMARWDRYVEGVDTEAIANRRRQAAGDRSASLSSTAGRMLNQPAMLPTDMAKVIGSYETVAALLDRMAALPGVKGLMLTFDDFVAGVEQFGQRIQPLMRCRQPRADASHVPDGLER